MSDIDGCIACDLTVGRRPLPGGLIAARDGWRVEHCVGPLGVGTVVVKPVRHVESVADLDDAEAAALGPLLRDVAAAVDEVTAPEQVYVSLWSHAERRRGHVHFVVQPVTTAAVEAHGGAYGPALQHAMFVHDLTPDASEVATVADRLRQMLEVT